jgi:hypothetical protein
MELNDILDPLHLKERKQQGVLYYFRGWEGFRDIIKTGEVRSGAFDAISFTRSYNMGEKIYSYAYQGKQIRFSLDGTKMSDRYKIEPFIDHTDTQIQRKYVQGFDMYPVHSENEERVVMPMNDSISILKYLIQIDILKSTIYKLNKTEDYFDMLSDRINEKFGRVIPLNIVDTFSPVKGVYA